MLSVIKVVLRSMMYSRSFLLLMITFSIPVSLSIALVSVPFAIYPLAHYAHTIKGYASVGLSSIGNESVLVLGSKNEGYLIHRLGLGLVSGKEGVLVSSNINKRINSTIAFSLNGKRLDYRINGIISSPFGLPIVVLPFYFNSTNASLSIGTGYALASAGTSLLKLTLLLSIIILLLSIPAQLFSYKKIIKGIEVTLANLKIAGASNREVLGGFLASSLIVSSLLGLYGISLGIFFYQSGIFLASHLNLVLPAATPSLSVVLLIFLASLTTSLFSSSLSMGVSVDKIPI